MSDPSTPPPPAKRRRARHDQGIKPPRIPLPPSLYHLAAQDLQPRRRSTSPTRSSPARSASETPITLEELKRRRLSYVKKNEADARRRRLLKTTENGVEVNGMGEDHLEANAGNKGGAEGEDSQLVQQRRTAQMPDITVDDDLPSSELLHALHHYASHFYSSMSIIGTLKTPAEWADFQRRRREKRQQERTKEERNRLAENALKKYREEGRTPALESTRSGSARIVDNAEAGPSRAQGSRFKTQRGRSTAIATTYSQRSHPLDAIDPSNATSTASNNQAEVYSKSDAGSNEQEAEEETIVNAASQSTVDPSRRHKSAEASFASSSPSVQGDVSDDDMDRETFLQEGIRLKHNWRREKKRDMRQAFNGSALMALGILIQEKTFLLLKEGGYVDDKHLERPGSDIELDVLFPRPSLGRADSLKRKGAAMVNESIDGSVLGESPAKRKRGRPRLYPPKEPVNVK